MNEINKLVLVKASKEQKDANLKSNYQSQNDTDNGIEYSFLFNSDENFSDKKENIDNFSNEELDLIYNDSLAIDEKKNREYEIITDESGKTIYEYLKETDDSGNIVSLRHLSQDGTLRELSNNGNEFYEIIKDKNSKIIYENKVETDSFGKIVTYLRKATDDGGYTETTYSGRTKTTIQRTFDSNNKKILKIVDAPGTQDDKKVLYTYRDGKIHSVTSMTEIAKVTGIYDWENYNVKKNTSLVDNPDGIIDDTKQRNIGECWLLTGLNGLRDNPQGSKILKDAIVKNNDNSYTVRLKGVKKSYTFTPEKIASYKYTKSEKEFSSGDIDTRLFEMAINEFRKEILSKPYSKFQYGTELASLDDPLRGGNLDEAIKIITGKNSTNIVVNQSEKTLKVSNMGLSKIQESKVNDVIESLKNNPDKYFVKVNFKESLDGLSKKESYKIKRVDENTIYVAKSDSESGEIPISKKNFMSFLSEISFNDRTKTMSKVNIGRINKVLDEKMNEPDKHILLVSFRADDIEFNDGKIVTSHAYQVKKVDDNNVCLINPWDSSKEIIYPRERFNKYISSYSKTDF